MRACVLPGGLSRKMMGRQACRKATSVLGTAAGSSFRILILACIFLSAVPVFPRLEPQFPQRINLPCPAGGVGWQGSVLAEWVVKGGLGFGSLTAPHACLSPVLLAVLPLLLPSRGTR